MSRTSEGWPRTAPAWRAPVRLVCFPHAGGSPTVFRTWRPRLPGSIEMAAVRCPGRPGSRSEAPPSSSRQLPARMVHVLVPLRDRPPVLFGHSTGATVAFEAATVLGQRFGIAVRHLFVSAASPRTESGPRGCTQRRTMSASRRRDDSTAGTGSTLDDPGYREVFLPVPRDDLRLPENHRGPEASPVTVPVTAYAGLDDPVRGPDEARRRRWFTRGRFALRAFTGGHFHLEDQGRLRSLRRSLGSQRVPRPPGSRALQATAST
ncbi:MULTISPECIES: alpha/beta fold hydrolase [unclassified Streptomyces]|uniref:thioesterase II family protein n=1 Tax=unclassified Streptomyces TaxID=2593676 RepID=UPI003332E3E4